MTTTLHTELGNLAVDQVPWNAEIRSKFPHILDNTE